MKRFWVVLALVLSLGVNVGLIGAALLRERMIDRFQRELAPGGDPGLRLADRLELAGETRTRFLAQQRRLADAVRELRPKIGELERRLRRELVAPAPDRARVEEISRALGEATLALDRAFIDNVLATREILDGRAERDFLRFVERFPGARRALGGDRPPRRPFRGPQDRRGPPPGSPADEPDDRAPDDSDPPPR